MHGFMLALETKITEEEEEKSHPKEERLEWQKQVSRIGEEQRQRTE